MSSPPLSPWLYRRSQRWSWAGGCGWEPRGVGKLCSSSPAARWCRCPCGGPNLWRLGPSAGRATGSPPPPSSPPSETYCWSRTPGLDLKQQRRRFSRRMAGHGKSSGSNVERVGRKPQSELTFYIHMNRGGQVTMLLPGTVKTPVGSGEFCGGMRDPYDAEVAGAPGHETFVLGESRLPVYRPIAPALQLQRGSGFDHNLWTLHHLRVEPDHWMSPFHCNGIGHGSVFLLAGCLEIEL